MGEDSKERCIEGEFLFGRSLSEPPKVLSIKVNRAHEGLAHGEADLLCHWLRSSSVKTDRANISGGNSINASSICGRAVYASALT